MKRFTSFIFAFALLLSMSAAAQTVSKSTQLLSDVPGKTAAQKQADTVANATTKTQSVQIAGYFDSVSIQASLTKISGTAAGKVYLLGSLDGSQYEKADSLTVANVATQTKVFTSNPSKYVYYRISFVGSGTQSTSFKSVAVYRKR